jgi:DNA-directed RNA polymerase subunit beta
MAVFTKQWQGSYPPRKSFARLPEILEVPNLLQVQMDSYNRFQQEGLRVLLEEISPIQDFTGNRFDLSFVNPETGQPRYEFRLPEHSIEECRERDLTYTSPLYVSTWLLNKETGEIPEHTIFMGNFPQMTPWGTLIINGAERVVVSQLIRSPGVYYNLSEDATSGRELASGKLIPDRGAWLEFETSHRNALMVKTNGKRRIFITTFLRALGFTEEDQERLFREVDTGPHHFIKSTLERSLLEREEAATEAQALVTIFKKLRPGDPANEDNARSLLYNLLFNPRRYDLGIVGRHKLNQKLGRDLLLIKEVITPAEAKRMSRHEMRDLVSQHFTQRVLTKEDMVAIVRQLIRVNNGEAPPDDIDHLGNRRVRTIGELIQNQFRIGLIRLERVVKERMTLVDPTQGVTAAGLVNIRPVVAAVKEFFGGSQLSQFMDQTNPVAELTHKRRLSAMGPGGLSRERAGFEVRDVHPSHYGRICPIETPEGPNIGLIGSLASFSRVNRLGFIETPLRRVYRELPSTDPRLLGRTIREPVKTKSGSEVAGAGQVVDEELRHSLAQLRRPIPIVPFASGEVEYLPADDEEAFIIAQPNTPLDELGQLAGDKVEVRHGNRYYDESRLLVDYMDVSPRQIVSVTTALIPFLEHDDANRALMGSNMQRQAVPLIAAEAPTVATGMEELVARDSGQVVLCRADGVVTSVSAAQVVVRRGDGEEELYPLLKFLRTNQGTCVNQHPIVSQGQRVVTGQVLADSYASDRGELALGQNVMAAFMSWEGYNFEDAVIISQAVPKEDKFTSIHIERYEAEGRETKLGPEEITRDIPNVGEESLRNLDEDGFIRVGAHVVPGDILVGKITPKGEAELSPEEKLLRAIFGEKARDVKDTSLRIPHGEGGKVIAVRVFSRENDDELPAGVLQMVRVWVAQKRKISVGDKIAGRHGNKGVISIIMPEAEMPFLPDGRPVELVLNPIGVPSRMNLGQILETHLGGAAHALGYRALCPVFDGATSEDIEEALAQAWIVYRAGAVNPSTGEAEQEVAVAWLQERGYNGEAVFASNPPGEAIRTCLRLWLQDVGVDTSRLEPGQLRQEAERLAAEKGLSPPIFGKVALRDGRTGDYFDQPITVGYVYLMKLIHLVEDKIHARSTGPYSLITQQPLGGKAQFGGQRFGEMEVWALEAYGAAYNLQELLTVKSDDVTGRSRIYEAIVKGEEVLQPGLPESFRVLIQELKSLGLAVEVLSEEEPGGLADEGFERHRLTP